MNRQQITHLHSRFDGIVKTVPDVDMVRLATKLATMLAKMELNLEELGV